MNLVDIVLGLAIVALLIANQLRARQITTSRLVLFPLLLVVLGLLQVGSGLAHTSFGVLLLVVGLILAAVLGAGRGFATKIWVGPNGGFWRKGGALLLALWVISVLAKVGIDYAGVAAHARVGAGVIFIELGVTLAAQNLVVAGRSYGWNQLLSGTGPQRTR